MLTMKQVQSAMNAMMAKAMQAPDEPVAIAIVDAAGNLEAYAKMDNLRIFSRRHALRKAYTSAVLGMDSGANAVRLHGQGRSISEMGDPQMTYGQGGLVKPTFPRWLKNPKVIRSFFLIRCLFLHRWPSRWL